MDLHTHICGFGSKCMKWVNDVCNIHGLVASLAIKMHPYGGGGVREWQRFQNSGVRTYVNALIQKNNENASAIVKINFFKILETNQKLTKIQGVHLRKTDKPCLEHITMPQTTPLLNSAKNYKPCRPAALATGTVSTCSPEALGVDLLGKHHFQNTVWTPWKGPLQKALSMLSVRTHQAGKATSPEQSDKNN